MVDGRTIIDGRKSPRQSLESWKNHFDGAAFPGGVWSLGGWLATLLGARRRFQNMLIIETPTTLVPSQKR